MKYKLFVTTLFLSSAAFASDLPNPKFTPGDFNPDVTQENIQSTICVKGYSKTIRPPVSFTNKLKKIQLEQFGYADKTPGHYKEDHLIALSLGGAARSTLNLWPQTVADAALKDRLEYVLNEMVCANEVPLKVAQEAMATDWIAAYKKYVPSGGKMKFKNVD